MRTRENILDELLVLRCQNGEATALALLARRWQPRLLRLAQRILGSRGPASDVVQDAWIAIVRGLPRLEDPARWRSWAYRIVSNKARDWIRREQTRRRWVEKRDPGELPPVATSDGDEAVHALRQALHTLEPERRTMLEMFYSEGMAVGEIAEALGIPAGTVKSRLYHIRKSLRETLEESQ